MEDINGNKIKELQEIGTRKYNLMINKMYLVNFKEINNSYGKGSYSNGHFTGLNTIMQNDIIIVSEDKKDAMIIDGRFNLKSILEKLMSDMNYKFYNVEIIEIGD